MLYPPTLYVKPECLLSPWCRRDAREERVCELEADRDALVAPYAEVVREALYELSGEERARVYEMLRLEVRPDPVGYELSGCSVLEGRGADVVLVLRKTRRVHHLLESLPE
jgi:hypothetical protein